MKEQYAIYLERRRMETFGKARMFRIVGGGRKAPERASAADNGAADELVAVGTFVRPNSFSLL
jgi:hypothetical protein